MTMTPDQVADHLAVERLHYDYAAACDLMEKDQGGNAQAILFTEDGTWQSSTTPEITGRDAIRQNFAESVFLAPTHHFFTNLRVDLAADGMTAATTAYLLMFSRVTPIAGEPEEPRLVTRASRYATTSRKTDGTWLLSSLKLEFQYGDPIRLD